MPSDVRVTGALGALSPLVTQYRSAVAATLEEVRAQLTQHSASEPARAAQLKQELGAFAGGRIDAERLASLLGGGGPLSPAASERLLRASQTLGEIVEAGDRLIQISVPRGGDLTTIVRARLAEIGRAFAAARVVAPAVLGRAMTDADDRTLATLPFRQWNQAERRLGPPLVISVHGEDCYPAGLAEFLDGHQKIVLVVEGDAPPAALVRLITPAVFVAQSGDVTACERIAEWPGAAVVALLSETASHFTHDPAGGAELWQRLSIAHVPPPASIAGFSSAQLGEELRQLEAFAHRPVSTTPADATPAAPADSQPPAPDAADSVDRVAAWLLQHAALAASSGGE